MARKKEENIESNINNNIIQDDIDYYFLEFCKIHNIKDIYKIPATQFTAALIYINHKYITPNRILTSKYSPGNKKYNIFAINALADRYIYMTYVFSQPISLLAFSHLSGINYDFISRWRNDNNTITVSIQDYYKFVGVNGNNNDIYNSGLRVVGDKVTISYRSIHTKLVNNIIYNADSIALYKSGVNSIAYANRVHDKLDKERNEHGPIFDMTSAAAALGISDKIQAIEDKNSSK